MSPRYASDSRLEPGTVIVGRWAHVKYSGHHLIASYDREPPVLFTPGLPWLRGEAAASRWITSSGRVRTACGREYPQAFVWHDPALPHLPKCKTGARCE